MLTGKKNSVALATTGPMTIHGFDPITGKLMITLVSQKINKRSRNDYDLALDL